MALTKLHGIPNNLSSGPTWKKLGLKFATLEVDKQFYLRLKTLDLRLRFFLSFVSTRKCNGILSSFCSDI